MSGLDFNYEQKEDGEPMEQYEVKERLALTEDDRLVPEGDPDARWLFAIPGRPIPMADAIKYGLVKEKAESAVESVGADKSRVAASKRGRRVEKKP